jgi:hypothetical protein
VAAAPETQSPTPNVSSSTCSKTVALLPSACQAPPEAGRFGSDVSVCASSALIAAVRSKYRVCDKVFGRSAADDIFIFKRHRAKYSIPPRWVATIAKVAEGAWK